MHYTGNEIVEIAVRIEENGYSFYTKAAEFIGRDNDIRSLFMDLAEKEVLHIAIFQKLLAKFEPEDYSLTGEDASDYITHLAESHIFGKPNAWVDLAKTMKSPREALQIAFKFENDSVAFYTELASRAKADSQKLIRRIIEEEKEHAAEISRFM